ncbi:hypothetical protein VNI00_004485 [Paramarasmius palmivorus]|uniref:F-box protein n=1 Tax=Paramarasmius palmivorus TaxID=297713 RepID=A0AAW0DFA2_9AGAR
MLEVPPFETLAEPFAFQSVELDDAMWITLEERPERCGMVLKLTILESGKRQTFPFLSANFPNLKSLTLKDDVEVPHVADFIERHNSIVRLVLPFRTERLHHWQQTHNNPHFHRIPFPQLQSLHGSDVDVAAFVAGKELEHLPNLCKFYIRFIPNWMPTSFQYDSSQNAAAASLLQRLGTITNDRLITFSFRRFGWHEDIFPLIMQHLPNIKQLEAEAWFGCPQEYCFDEGEPLFNEDLAELIKRLVEQLKHMVEFIWILGDYHRRGGHQDDPGATPRYSAFKKGAEVVVDLGERSSSLQYAQLFRAGAWKRVGGSSVWVPAPKASGQAEDYERYLRQALMFGSYPRLAFLVSIIRDRLKDAGQLASSLFDPEVVLSYFDRLLQEGRTDASDTSSEDSDDKDSDEDGKDSDEDGKDSDEGEGKDSDEGEGKDSDEGEGGDSDEGEGGDSDEGEGGDNGREAQKSDSEMVEDLLNIGQCLGVF